MINKKKAPTREGRREVQSERMRHIPYMMISSVTLSVADLYSARTSRVAGALSTIREGLRSLAKKEQIVDIIFSLPLHLGVYIV